MVLRSVRKTETTVQVDGQTELGPVSQTADSIYNVLTSAGIQSDIQNNPATPTYNNYIHICGGGGAHDGTYNTFGGLTVRDANNNVVFNEVEQVYNSAGNFYFGMTTVENEETPLDVSVDGMSSGEASVFCVSFEGGFSIDGVQQL